MYLRILNLIETNHKLAFVVVWCKAFLCFWKGFMKCHHINCKNIAIFLVFSFHFNFVNIVAVVVIRKGIHLGSGIEKRPGLRVCPFTIAGWCTAWIGCWKQYYWARTEFLLPNNLDFNCALCGARCMGAWDTLVGRGLLFAQWRRSLV